MILFLRWLQQRHLGIRACNLSPPFVNGDCFVVVETNALLRIFQEVLHRSKNTLHFIRLHAPWPLLCRYAEELNLRAPIQVSSLSNLEIKYSFMFILVVYMWESAMLSYQMWGSGLSWVFGIERKELTSRLTTASQTRSSVNYEVLCKYRRGKKLPFLVYFGKF